MNSQILNTQGDYIVSIYSDYDFPNHSSWHPLINFGDYQGDVKLFIMSIINRFDDSFLEKMAKQYNPKNKYYLKVCEDGILRPYKQKKL